MTDLTPFPGQSCERLEGLSPGVILARLAGMSRVRISACSAGVIHERIGPLERVVRSGGTARIEGACHAATVDLAALSAVVLDRGPLLAGAGSPRLDFLDIGGVRLFSVMAMGGLGRFERLVTRTCRSPVRFPAGGVSARRSPVRTMPPDDAARRPFCQRCDTGVEAAITLDRIGLRQSWRGRIEGFTVAMGYLTVETPDFRLHIAAGAIARWRPGPDGLAAICPEGRPLGLTLASPALA
ncbi:hypothetical protein [Rhodovulum strictum]|uniref:Haemin-degrading HemS/ChuX domain-containing protein n=1 Tax=Rhodovulum strictum TaxID=58314 RepID=A0A844BRZ6_9RHOB|nr:hypothetical protein [Rhodovulum strictum]MRH22707.1 hypothetical protein [Rhodovulum strictum]